MQEPNLGEEPGILAQPGQQQQGLNTLKRVLSPPIVSYPLPSCWVWGQWGH